MKSLLRSILLGALLVLLGRDQLVAQHSVANCPIVDIGILKDGITTITVMEASHPCNAGSKWAGWNCMTLNSRANNNGVTYRLEVRWNRVDQPVRGSVTWVKGNNSTGFHRDSLPNAAAVQDALDEFDQVRTIELRFLGQGTATHPRNGFVNISAVFADALEFLAAQQIASGVKVFLGSSSASVMGANALSRHRLKEICDGFVFVGGPYAVNLESACTDPQTPGFMNDEQRAEMDGWNWKDLSGGSYCYDMAAVAFPSYGCLSVLGPDADVVYKQVMISVIIGTGDSPWIENAALEYLSKVTPKTATFDRPEGPHQVMITTQGAAMVYQRICEIVETKLSHALSVGKL